MKPLDRHPELGQGIHTLRILVRAMALGLGCFLGVVAYLHYGQAQDTSPEGSGLLTSLALALAGLLVVSTPMVRQTLMRRAQAAWTVNDLPGFQRKYAAAVILGAAMVEGAGLLLGVAFLIEKDPMALTAAVLCLLILLAAVPSLGKLDALLEMAS